LLFSLDVHSDSGFTYLYRKCSELFDRLCCCCRTQNTEGTSSDVSPPLDNTTAHEPPDISQPIPSTSYPPEHCRDQNQPKASPGKDNSSDDTVEAASIDLQQIDPPDRRVTQAPDDPASVSNSQPTDANCDPEGDNLNDHAPNTESQSNQALGVGS
jgi:hypothetical protein